MSIISTELASVVTKEFGEVLQCAEVEIMVVDKEKKAHSQAVTDAWAKFGIKVWPDAGKVKDLTPIAEIYRR